MAVHAGLLRRRDGGVVGSAVLVMVVMRRRTNRRRGGGVVHHSRLESHDARASNAFGLFSLGVFGGERRVLVLAVEPTGSQLRHPLLLSGGQELRSRYANAQTIRVPTP